ncbi:T9SS type A sorting domain-containing protein [Labilibacter sediminis]|nr:T9SS type A sorting domain-containing protein [Labilibacter sediminis]
MKNLSIWFLVLRMVFTCAEISSQVVLSLEGNVRTISPNYIGYNGRSTEGPSWSNASFLNLVEELGPGTVRYPAGTQANYWDWRTGTFIEGHGTKKYLFTIDDFVNGLPEESSIIYVVNMARPTPATGVSSEAAEEELKSDATLQLKIDDMLAALAKFERLGRLPEAVELGNEFYFNNEHAAIYAADPVLYINHSKKICQRIKAVYPELKILMITTKGGTTSRDFWNSTIFDALESDSELTGYIHAVVQHHYINDNYGDITQVTDEATAKVAMAEGFLYPREHQSDHDMVPDNLDLWLTEFGATKKNAVDTWASGLRGVAMTLGFMDQGDKHERFIIHHITDDPEIIHKAEMKLGAVGMSYGLLANAARGKTKVQKINFSNNPFIHQNIEALHGYKFRAQDEETIFILNMGDQELVDVDISAVTSYSGTAKLVQYWNTTPYTTPTYQGNGIDEEEQVIANIVTIKPFSVLAITVINDGTPVEEVNWEQQIVISPTIIKQEFKLVIKDFVGDEELMIYDLSGKLHYQSKIYQRESIHMPTLSIGVYLAIVNSKEKIHSIKLIKSDQW